MAIVTAPFVGGIAIDRLANLFRARRANGPLGLVELEAGRLEIQSAVAQQASDLRFGIVHHALVDHPMDPAREHAVDMSHQPHIVGVITADMLEIVGERLSPREMLAEVRETATKRMPPRVDDFGVGQDEMDKRHEHPVVRQLVDEERPVCASLDRRSFQILLAQCPPLRFGQIEDALRIIAGAPRQEGNVGQLGRALDQAVRRQNLFEQRRPGARHADDEDRIGRFASAASFVQRFRREHGDAAVDRPSRLVHRIGLQLQPKRVAARIMVEGVVEASGIVHRLAQRKLQVQPVLVAQRAFAERRLHRLDVRFVEFHRLEVGEAPPRLAEQWAELDRLAISRDPVVSRPMVFSMWP